jgi:hypothetical protein
MKALGPVLAVIGVIVATFAYLNHSNHYINGPSASTIIGVIGVVLILAGAGMTVMGRRTA